MNDMDSTNITEEQQTIPTYTLFSMFGKNSALKYNANEQLTSVTGEATVTVLSSYFTFDPSRNNRPSIIISTKLANDHYDDDISIRVKDYQGRPINLKLAGEDESQTAVYDYQFTNEQLARLVSKNFFKNGYELPELLTSGDGVMQLPITMRIARAEGRDNDGTMRSVFVGIIDDQYIPTNEEKSGYDLIDEFAKEDVEDDVYTDDFNLDDMMQPAPEPVLEKKEDTFVLSAEERSVIQRMRNDENARRQMVAEANNAASVPKPVAEAPEAAAEDPYPKKPEETVPSLSDNDLYDDDDDDISSDDVSTEVDTSADDAQTEDDTQAENDTPADTLVTEEQKAKENSDYGYGSTSSLGSLGINLDAQADDDEI